MVLEEMNKEPPEFPHGEQQISRFLEDVDEHLDFGPILVEIGSKYTGYQYYVCHTRAEFEDAIKDVSKTSTIGVQTIDTCNSILLMRI